MTNKIIYNMFKQLFLFAALIYSNTVEGFVYRITKLAKENKQSYLFYVNHVSPLEINNANNFQRRDFIELAKQLQAAVIVEDGFMYNINAFIKDFLHYNNNKYYCIFPLLLFFKRNIDILSGLSSLCRYAHIPVTNVEFRYYSYLPSLKEMHAHYFFMRDEIKKYDNGIALNEIYDYGLQECCKGLKILNTKIQDNPHYDFSLIGFDLNLYTSHLLDMRIMHQFVEYEKDYNTTFIIAGGWHTTNIKHYLEKLGYTTQCDIEIHPYSKNTPENSLKNIFLRYFGYESSKSINDLGYSVVLALFDVKNFCDVGLLRYLINRYTTPVIASFLLTLPLYSLHDSKIAQAWLSLCVWIFMIKTAPKILMTPCTV